jgi:AraC-like DNA-binding protein
MDKFSVLSIIGIFTVFVSLLLAFFLFTVKTSNKNGNLILACYFVMIAIDMSGFFIYKYTSSYPSIEILRWTMSFLTMPLFYLYSLSVCYTDFRLKPVHLLHIIPFIIINAVLLPRFYTGTADEKLRLIQDLPNTPERLFMHFSGELQFLCYIAALFLLLKKFKHIHQENYTNSGTTTYKWLFQITIVFLTAHCFVVTKEILKYTDYENAFIWANVVVGTVALSVLCWFVLKALYNPGLFRGVNSSLPLVKDIIPAPAVRKDTNESGNSENAAIPNQVTMVKKYMAEQEPYLEPNLTIQELATRLKIPARDLSILINHHIGQHFFDFVNEYRIKKAMEILKDPAKAAFTVQEIFYEVGFNSKSSFNTAFKKHTGQTPTIYKKSS